MNCDRYPDAYGTKADHDYCCVPVKYKFHAVGFGRSFIFYPEYHQCTRKRGYGPDKAYCKQHAKGIKE